MARFARDSTRFRSDGASRGGLLGTARPWEHATGPFEDNRGFRCKRNLAFPYKSATIVAGNGIFR